MPGLVPTEELTPGDLVGTNKDSYLILEKLPAEYDNRVKAMEVDEKPTEEYSDIGGELTCEDWSGLCHLATRTEENKSSWIIAEEMFMSLGSGSVLFAFRSQGGLSRRASRCRV